VHRVIETVNPINPTPSRAGAVRLTGRGLILVSSAACAA
jgi:hypothetical protein